MAICNSKLKDGTTCTKQTVWNDMCEDCLHIYEQENEEMSSIEKIKKLKTQLEKLQVEIIDIEFQIQKEEENLPYIYGRCKKELECQYQSDYHNTTDTAIVNPGDVIQFFKYPHHQFVTKNINSWEFIYIPYSEEYFDFFSSTDDVECRSFYKD